ncbi:UNVERIFIED_CONTAM: hypothetical protein FKN15_014508 [Acipenser sinensis]
MLVKVNIGRNQTAGSGNILQYHHNNNNPVSSQPSKPTEGCIPPTQADKTQLPSKTPASPGDSKQAMQIKKTDKGSFCLVMSNNNSSAVTYDTPQRSQAGGSRPGSPKYASTAPIYDEPPLESPIYDEPPMEMEVEAAHLQNGPSAQHYTPTHSLQKQQQQQAKLLQHPSVQQQSKHKRNPSTTEYSPAGRECIKHMVNVETSSKQAQQPSSPTPAGTSDSLASAKAAQQQKDISEKKQSWRILEANVLKSIEARHSRQNSLASQEYPTVATVNYQDSGYSTGPSPSLRRKNRRRQMSIGEAAFDLSEVSMLTHRLHEEMWAASETCRDSPQRWQPTPGSKAAMLVKVNIGRNQTAGSGNVLQYHHNNNHPVSSQPSKPTGGCIPPTQADKTQLPSKMPASPGDSKQAMQIKKTDKGSFCLVMSNNNSSAVTYDTPQRSQTGGSRPGSPKYASTAPIYDEPPLESPIYDEPPMEMEVEAAHLQNGPSAQQYTPTHSLQKQQQQQAKLLQHPSVQQQSKHKRNPSATEYSPAGRECIKHMVNVETSSKQAQQPSSPTPAGTSDSLASAKAAQQQKDISEKKQSWRILEANVLKSIEARHSRQNSLASQEYPTVATVNYQDSGYSTGPSPSLRRKNRRRQMVGGGQGRPGSVGSNGELSVLNEKLMAEMRAVVGRSGTTRGSKASLDTEMSENSIPCDASHARSPLDSLKKYGGCVGSRDDITASNRSLYRPGQDARASCHSDTSAPTPQTEGQLRQKRTYEKVDSLEKSITSQISLCSPEPTRSPSQAGTLESNSKLENGQKGSGTLGSAVVGYQFPYATLRKPPAEASMADWASKNLNMHTQGIFRRRVSIANMLSWNRGSIKKPMLITSDRTVKKEACDMFKLVQVYMGDRQARLERPHVALVIVTKCWSMQALRDELYIQLVRQTTDNLCHRSMAAGWELLAISLAFFSPSPKFRRYLEGYIQRHLDPAYDKKITQSIKDQLETKNKKNSKSRKKRKQNTEEGLPISTYAQYCYRKLQKVAVTGGKKGLRKPTIEEIDHAKNAIVTPSLFGSALEEIMQRQHQLFPDRKLPWAQIQLSQYVLALGGAQTEGIFRVPGDIDEVNALKLLVDQWKIPDNLSDPTVPASLLKLWYRELEEPLIPQSFYQQCISNYENPEAAIAVVHFLPELNRLVLCYLIHFLQVFNVRKMSKNPPNRRGIVFEVGAHLEARDTLKNCCNRARESSYTVKFYDGVIHAVKDIHVKPYRNEKSGGKSKIEDKQKEKVCDKEKSTRGHKVREKFIDIKEQSSTPKSKKYKRNETENKRAADKEDNDRKVPVKGEVQEESKKPKRGSTSEMVKEERKVSRVKTVDKKKTVEETKKKEEEKNVESGEETTEKSETSAEQETSSKESKKEDNRLAEKEKSQQPEEALMENKDAENTETEVEKQTEPEEKKTEPEEKVPDTKAKTAEGSVDGTKETGKEENRGETSKQKGQAEEKKEKEAAKTTAQSTEDREPAAELGDSKPAEQSPNQARRKRGRPPSKETKKSSQSGSSDQDRSRRKSSRLPLNGHGQHSIKSMPVTIDSKHTTQSDSKQKESATVYTAIKRSQDSLSPKALTIDPNHTFKCKVPDCLKSFRKAKLLHYHMKYYHGVDKAAESEQSPTKRSIQTRASEKQAALENPKRRRTISASLHIPLHSAHRNLPSSRTDSKVGKLHERRRTSAPPAVNMLHNHRPSLREKSKENQLEKSNRKQQEKEKDKGANDTVKEKEKIREKKHREFLRVKLKKKKKKKKNKSAYTGSEENIDISRDFSPKKIFVQSKLNLSHKSPFSHKHKLLYNSSPGYTEKIKVDDEDTVSDSSTDSLLWSEDELGQDVDVTTNPDDDGPNEGHREFEIVRCICEVQEENDFMIQCEECLCWQHGVCMGLLEDNVPEKYTCYICRDPPGQRQSLKYWYDKDWLSNGHMYGLSFLEENYSHQNAKKIAATHQLLGDVHKVIEVLNGLQLKMSILQSQAHPDLKFRCQSWKQVDSKEKPRKRQVAAAGQVEGQGREISAAEKPCRIPSVQESYIASEHCYQKPRTYYPAVEQRLVVETRGSELEERMRGFRENGEDLLVLEQRYGRSPDQDRRKADWEPRLEKEQDKEAEVSKRSCSGESCNVKVAREDRDSDMNFQQQWQINLMDHIEAVQDEVIHRMDFIERELDVLESWLDYTGELEPPEPLARLPQLKHRIKQLLMELGKVQQIALCCST